MTTTRRPPLPPEPEPAPAATVRHIYRASIKIGDDFRTLECEIVVPVGASDELIREAQNTARRVREAQAEDTEREIEAMREDAQLAGSGRSSRYTIRDPEAPASTKQRNAIERMAAAKGWDNTRLVNFCELAGVPLLTLTKGGASWLIDALNGVPMQPPVPASFTLADEGPLPFEPGEGDTTPAKAHADTVDQDIPF
ncbi:hypothetical protein [Chloroflexus sp.]|uniref:hypothetical protein n=1 Tax=Chloroflexus sp. TaxID=1904827 RepID=UPI002ACD3929|nr:hypothetical protein [Chloroflexus sp.]